MKDELGTRRESLALMCHCADARHVVEFTPDCDEDGRVIVVWVTVTGNPANWRERLALAWRALTGRDPTYAEVVLSSDDARRLAEFMGELKYKE